MFCLSFLVVVFAANAYGQTPNTLPYAYDSIPTQQYVPTYPDVLGEFRPRGYFADLAGVTKAIFPLDKNVPLSYPPKRTSFNPLQAPKWQIMMTPFLYLLPALGNYCDCQGMADCGCCLGFLINPVGLQNNVCFNMSLTEDSYTNSQYMVHARLYYDNYKVLDVSLSEKRPPLACVNIIPFNDVAGCLAIADVFGDAEEQKVCVSLAASLQLHNREVFGIQPGSFCLGRPVPPNRKRGIFGLDYEKTLRLLTGVLGRFV